MNLCNFAHLALNSSSIVQSSPKLSTLFYLRSFREKTSPIDAYRYSHSLFVRVTTSPVFVNNNLRSDSLLRNLTLLLCCSLFQNNRYSFFINYSTFNWFDHRYWFNPSSQTFIFLWLQDTIILFLKRVFRLLFFGIQLIHSQIRWDMARINCVRFNQDDTCFACGLNDGFAIFNVEPLKEILRVNLASSIRIVEPLYRCSILALVGEEIGSEFDPNKG